MPTLQIGAVSYDYHLYGDADNPPLVLIFWFMGSKRILVTSIAGA